MEHGRLASIALGALIEDDLDDRVVALQNVLLSFVEQVVQVIVARGAYDRFGHLVPECEGDHEYCEDA